MRARRRRRQLDRPPRAVAVDWPRSAGTFSRLCWETHPWSAGEGNVFALVVGNVRLAPEPLRAYEIASVR